MADQLIVRRWLIDLGRLTAARSSHDEAADFIETSTPMLAMRFPDEVFNPASLEHVAAECKYLPTYGEVTALLRHWRSLYRPPKVAALPGPVPAMPKPRTEAEIDAAARIVKQVSAELEARAVECDARRARGITVYQTNSHHLTRAELAESYRRAGIEGPGT